MQPQAREKEEWRSGGGERKLFRLKVMRETTGDVRKSVTGRGRSFDAANVLL